MLKNCHFSNGLPIITKVSVSEEECTVFYPKLNKISRLGAILEIVTDKSQEGSQFVRGFGGVGGILRYKVDLQNLNIDEDADPIDYSKFIC